MKKSLKSVSETSAGQKRGRRERLKTRKNVQKPSKIYDKIVMKCVPITLRTDGQKRSRPLLESNCLASGSSRGTVDVNQLSY